ncbi:MAG TPA: hypothetical protein VIW47_16280, partial [Nitrospiraceae bacterium]
GGFAETIVVCHPLDTPSNFGKEATIRRLFKKFRLLTYPTPAAISPARPESAKTASSSGDATFRGQGRSE